MVNIEFENDDSTLFDEISKPSIKTHIAITLC